MYKLKKQEISASDIAQYLNLPLCGEDFPLHGPHEIKIIEGELKKEIRNENIPILYFTNTEKNLSSSGCYIVTNNPYFDVALILKEFFSTPIEDGIHKTAQIGPDVIMGRNVRVGANCVIDSNVEISDNTWIMNNVSIHGPVVIGKSTVIKSGAVIGSEGYSFVEDGQGNYIHPPQLGRIRIGENVWIGSNSTIERAMLSDTIVEKGVKIDDLVHIGKGSCIGENSMITAGCVIAYDVRIGRNVVLGPNVTIRESLSIIDEVVIGQGAVVVKDIDTPGIYVGTPARYLKKR